MSQQPSKSKELRIVTRPVITIDAVKSNKRAVKLLLLISELGGATEKAIAHVVKELKASGLDLGYNIVEIAGIPTSKELRDDITAMLYVGLLESSPGKKLSLTSQGKELMGQIQVDQAFASMLKEKLPEVKTRLATVLAEADLGARRKPP